MNQNHLLRLLDAPAVARKCSRTTCSWYALSALIVIMACGATYYGYAHLCVQNELLDRTRQWQTFRAQMNELADSVVGLQAPINDVFESQNVLESRQLLQQAHERFEARHADLYAAIPTHIHEGERNRFDTQLHAMHDTGEQLVYEAEAIFTALEAGRIMEAANQLATADRRCWYGIVQLNDVRRTLNEVCREHEIKIHNRTRRLTITGVGIGLALLGLVVIVIYFGLRLTRTSLRVSEFAQFSASQLQAILDSAVDPIVTINRQGEIVTFNRAAEKEFGYSAETMIGQNVNRLMPEPYRGEHDQYLANYLHTGESKLIGRGREAVAMRADGSTFPIELSVSEVQHAGERLFTGIIRNITDQKFIETQLAAARNEAEAANRAKSEFLANMSHEIRTPMTAILGYSEMLVGDDAGEQTPEQRRHALHTIRRSGQYLLELINDILDLSRIEAGRLSVVPVVCSPRHVLSEVVSWMQVRAQEKNLPLTVRFDSRIPEHFVCDPKRLRQILLNLVGNAIKFTNRGSVEMVCRVVGCDQPSPRLEFAVIDTGVGMNDDQIAKLFRPFSQADASLSRKVGGTGLGLCISKRLIDLLGGTIGVQSVPGEGTTFSVSIPIVGAPRESWIDVPALLEPSKAPAEAPRVERLDCRVLLVEDGPDNQRLIAYLLKKAGAEVTIACDGLEGVKAAEKAVAEGRPFEVILMDMAMPVMDGYTATRTLREQGYTRPIIALTAHAMVGDDRKCLEAGCNDYDTKPIDRQRLIAKVASLVARARDAAAASASAV